VNEVIAIIRPDRWSATELSLQGLNLPPPTHHRVLGRGREQGLRYLSRQGAVPGTEVKYLPKRMVSWLVEEEQLTPLIGAIIEANRTGQMGDGKIFVLPVEVSTSISSDQHEIEELEPEPIAL
jgi:nitrogen regulatory protein PII 2